MASRQTIANYSMITKDAWEVDALYREPYILKGYRKPCCSLKESLRYTLHLHNDAFNFWTHFVPFVIWSIGLLRELDGRLVQEPLLQPLLCFRLAMCMMAFFSSVAHGFSTSHTPICYHILFMLDYVGISMCALTWNTCFLFYKWMQPGASPQDVLTHRVLWMIVFATVSVVCTIVTCVSRFWFKKETVLLRMFAFGAPVVLSFSIHILQSLETSVLHVEEDSSWYYMQVYLFLLVAVFFYGSKIPEKILPGKFDILGHSHQLFHIFGAASVHMLNKAITEDAKRVQRWLIAHETATGANFNLTTGINHTWSLFMTVLVANLSVVFAIAYMGVGYRKKSAHVHTSEQHLVHGNFQQNIASHPAEHLNITLSPVHGNRSAMILTPPI